MATKRLHDIEIWRKSWFRNLSYQAKLLWFYIKDNCNCAGIAEIDDKTQISFFIGVKLTDVHFKEIEKQILTIDDKRILLIDFIDFQYGELGESHKMRKKILSELAKFDLKYPINTLSRNQDTVKDKDKDTVKDMDNDKNIILKETTWRDNTEEGFNLYLKLSEPHFDALLSDWSWVAIQKEYYPGCCVKRTMFRMWEQYWGTKAGWKNKRDAARGKPDYEMNWKQTIERNFKKSICYYGKNEADDEKLTIETKRKFGEL